jgi:hypothetical protein
MCARRRRRRGALHSVGVHASRRAAVAVLFFGKPRGAWIFGRFAQAHLQDDSIFVLRKGGLEGKSASDVGAWGWRAQRKAGLVDHGGPPAVALPELSTMLLHNCQLCHRSLF